MISSYHHVSDGEYGSEYEQRSDEDDKNDDSDQIGYSDDEARDIGYMNGFNEGDQGGIHHPVGVEEYVNVRRRDSGNENHDKEDDMEHVEHDDVNRDDFPSNIDREDSDCEYQEGASQNSGDGYHHVSDGEYGSEYEQRSDEDDKNDNSDQIGYSDDEARDIGYMNGFNEGDQGGIHHPVGVEEYVNVHRRDSGNENHDKEDDMEHVEHDDVEQR
ncbi:hypothetical protein CTI12_AA137930 [Artemisia annua]|uniref:Uncharacterized protein n=1 Tax=Artemisia annua TaxID=35608 RepID=A0A2U1NKN7_ARTAN|nr:hypothetical protein CTI12_AA137930 [Artemisia annua]